MTATVTTSQLSGGPAPFDAGGSTTPQWPDAIGARNFAERCDTAVDAASRLEAYGGAAGLWRCVLQPRLADVLPAAHVLEIGVGAGLLASRMLGSAKAFTGVDVSERSLCRCRERLGFSSNVRLVLNDGRSLELVPDRSIDVCVSFDALVGASRETMAAYLVQLSAKLAPGGVALLHHSNLAQHIEELTAKAGGKLDLTNPILGGRHPGMSAEALRADARVCNLRVVSQEIFGATDHGLWTDTLSFIARDPGGADLKPAITYRHDWALVQRESKRIVETYRAAAMPG